MSIISTYLNQPFPQIAFLEKFQQLLNGEEVSLPKMYKALRTKAEEGYGQQSESYQELQKQFLPSLDTFQTNLNAWLPRKSAPQEVYALPASRQHVILLGFLLQADAEDVNDLLQCAGMEALNGRVVLDVVFIAGLNNHWDYATCVFSLYQRYQNIAPSAGTPLRTYAALQNYVADNGVDIFSKSFTDFMTLELSGITTPEALDIFMDNNKENFRLHRESPRRFLCQQLVELWDAEWKDTQTEEEFTAQINGIWHGFLEFYDKDITSRRWEYLSFGGEARTVEENRLLEYINGTRALSYKMFVLLMVYFDAVQFTSYDGDALNEKCRKAGFPPVYRSNPSQFDVMVQDLLGALEEGLDVNNDKDVRLFFHKKIGKYVLLGLYCDFGALKAQGGKFLDKGNITQALYARVIRAANGEQKKLKTIQEIDGNSYALLGFVETVDGEAYQLMRASGAVYEALETALYQAAGKKPNPRKSPAALLENPLYLRAEYDF